MTANFGILLKYAFSLTDDREHAVTLDLTPAEFGAIGFVTAQWALLEHALYLRTQALAKRAKISVPTEARHNSFSRRLAAFRQCIEIAYKQKSVRDRFLKLAQKIANAEGQRHKITHGLWDFDPQRHNELFTYSLRPPHVSRRLEPINADKIAAFGETIGALTFVLFFPRGYTLARSFKDLARADGRVAFASRTVTSAEGLIATGHPHARIVNVSPEGFEKAAAEMSRKNGPFRAYTGPLK